MILLILIAVLFAYFGVYQFIAIPEQRLLSVITMAVAAFAPFFLFGFHIKMIKNMFPRF